MFKKFNRISSNCTTCPVLTGFYIILCTSFSYSQGTWTQKPNVFTTPRGGSIGFSIGSKGYMGCGWQFGVNICYNDFWEWDQVTNTWSQKANFPDSARGDAVAFSIGNKGYTLTGVTSTGTATNKLWEWDQATNTWSQKATFPGMPRVRAAAFSIGLKGYVGCGYYPSLGSLSDFWEYDQLTDTWIQKANMPMGRNGSVSFSIGNTGYVCAGGNASGTRKDLYAFDPLLNTWIQKADFPGGFRAYASGFSIGTMAYIGTGWNDVNSCSDFWQYDPSLNLWTQMANYPHAVTDIDHAGFSIGCKGYFGGGASNPNNALPYFNDFWEYEPDSCSLTGIEITNVENLEFLISPNPFSEKLNITINSSEPSEIIIYDNNSKKVLQKKFISAASFHTKSFAKGIYIYEVKNNPGVPGGFLRKGKIIKE